MDRNQQRQNRRSVETSFSCTAGAELSPDTLPIGRTGAACDPTPAAPAALPAVSLSACPPPPLIPLNLPDGLLVKSDAVTAFCPSTAGYSVTGTTAVSLSAGDQSQLVIFSGLTDITENQLNYLFNVVPSASASIISASLSGATASVIELTHLNYIQSEELIIDVQTAKTTINALAVDKARNLLLCQVENSLQAVKCPTAAYFGATGAVPPNLQYIPTATAATGSVLVPFALTPTSGNQAAFTAINIASLTAAAAQANAIAFAQAQVTLRCIYGNDATAAACCPSQEPGNNLGFTNCVPATGPTIPGAATAVGYFSIPANEIFSLISKTAANESARELSRNALNCYFPSQGVTATCVGLGLDGPFAPASVTSVYLPPGSVILNDIDSSVTAANIQATELATAALNCFWGNDATTVTCPYSGPFTGINNLTYNLPPSATFSPSFSSTLSANSVISYVSKLDADQLAFSLAQASLSCIYCNANVLPTCVGANNQTIGAPANLFCDSVASIAQNTAISLGSILAVSNSGVNCCFGNDEVKNTVFCGPTKVTALSQDDFILPANTITICASFTGPTGPTAAVEYYPYSNLYGSTGNAAVACCGDVNNCPGAISGTAVLIPTIWSTRTNLFDIDTASAVFYSNTAGTIWTNPNGYNYIAKRSDIIENRLYRVWQGAVFPGTMAQAQQCLACGSAPNPYEFNLKVDYLTNYNLDINSAKLSVFCSGQGTPITLYTKTQNPFSVASNFSTHWYTSKCNETDYQPLNNDWSNALLFYTATDPVSGTSKGYVLGFQPVFPYNTYIRDTIDLPCSGPTFLYSVKASNTACEIGSNLILYTNIENAFTANGSAIVQFYTQYGNINTPYSNNVYLNWTAPDGSIYYRYNQNNASPAVQCPGLPAITVRWAVDSPTGAIVTPWAQGETAPFNYSVSSTAVSINSNIRTVYMASSCAAALSNPFNNSQPITFYTGRGTDLSKNTPFIPGTGSCAANTYGIYLVPFMNLSLTGTTGPFGPTGSTAQGLTFVSYPFFDGRANSANMRQYTNKNILSTLAGMPPSLTQGLTPYLHSATGATALAPGGLTGSVNDALFYSAASSQNAVQTSLIYGNLNDGVGAAGGYFRTASATGCTSSAVYSYVRDIFTACSDNQWPIEYSLKRTPVIINSNSDLFAGNTDPLFYDGLGYKLADSVTGSNTSLRLLDLTRVGAAFPGAIVKFDTPYIGYSSDGSQSTNICPYIKSIDYPTGSIQLGGLFNTVASSIPANKPLYIVGFTLLVNDYDIDSTTGELFARIDTTANTPQLISFLQRGHSIHAYKYDNTINAIVHSMGYVTYITDDIDFPNYIRVYIATEQSVGNNFRSTSSGSNTDNSSLRIYIYGYQIVTFADGPNFFRKSGSAQGQPIVNPAKTSYSAGAAYKGARTLNTINSRNGKQVRVSLDLQYPGNIDTIVAIGNLSPWKFSSLSGTAIVAPYSATFGPYYSNAGDYFYLTKRTNFCDNTYLAEVTPIPDTKIKWLASSCCDIITSINGLTASACEFQRTFGNTAVKSASAPGVAARIIGSYGLVPGWTGPLIVLPADNSYTYVFEGVARLNEISELGVASGQTGGPFVRFNYDINTTSIRPGASSSLGYNLINVLPCNAKDATGVAYYSPTGATSVGFTGGWARKYIGYWDNQGVYPTYPSDDGVTIGSTSYWANNNYKSPTAVTGYVFREYIPDVSAATGCNCGNYVPVDYALNSGSKYSLWSSLTAAYEALPIRPWFTTINQDPELLWDEPIFTFNPCTTGCNNGTPCISLQSCGDQTPAANFSVANNLSFDAATYDVISPFNFSNAPEVGNGSTAKQTATQLAQNLVNSFVRCAYANVNKTGKPCDIGSITLAPGSVGAGEVISSSSQTDADRIAQIIADSRTVCLNPDEFGGFGCDGIQFKPTTVSTSIGDIKLQITNEGDCQFTPVLSMQSDLLKLQTATILKVAMCTGGAPKYIYLPTLQLGQIDSVLRDGQQIRLAYRRLPNEEFGDLQF